MSLMIGLDCGDRITLISPFDEIPDGDDAWAMYPLIEEHPIELGDEMTCAVCGCIGMVRLIYPEV